MRAHLPRRNSLKVRILLCMVALVLAACGESVREPFEVAYLTYGRPDYPLGTLVRMEFTASGGFATVHTAELSREACLLLPGPHPEPVLPFLTIVGSADESVASLWEWPYTSEAGPRYAFEFPGRVPLLWSARADAQAVLIVYVPSTQVRLRTAEYGREIVTLQANSRCSVAVMYRDRPGELQPLAGCRYARAAWLAERQAAFIARSGELVACDLDSLTCDTMARGAEAISTAPSTGMIAVAYEGDSVSVFRADGSKAGPTLMGASVPALSPDGRYLAAHRADQGLRIVELESGTEREVGLGYPVGWSENGELLLFFERQTDERRITHTLFHVAAAATGARVSLPEDGFTVDAVFLP